MLLTQASPLIISDRLVEDYLCAKTQVTLFSSLAKAPLTLMKAGERMAACHQTRTADGPVVER